MRVLLNIFIFALYIYHKCIKIFNKSKRIMKKTPNEKFSDWLKTLTIGSYADTITKLADFCGVSKNVITFWKNGRTKIKPAYQKLINEFADKKIF